MALHTLKGNAATLGVTALAEQARRLEDMCKTELGQRQCQAELGGLAVFIEQAKLLLKQAITVLDAVTATAPLPAVS